MENGQRKKWLSGLREGDKVFNISYDQLGQPIEVNEFKVEKITPTGRIRLDNSSHSLLDENGYKRDEWGIGNIYILPLDVDVQKAFDQIKARALWVKLQEEFKDINEDRLDYEKLLIIRKQINSMKW
jgi:hypothetical protein